MEVAKFVFLILMVFAIRFDTFSSAEDLFKDVKVRCYDGNMARYYEYALDEASNLYSKLDVNRPTVFYVHGWTQNVDESETLSKIVSAFLQRNEHNVCALSYKNMAEKFYTVLFDNIPLLSEKVASVLKNWIQKGVDENRIHLIGYSIGAHACGSMGRALQRYGYNIGRITGLDPSNPIYCTGFGKWPHSNALHKNDAKFVDVIHTDGGYAGCKLPLGHADFYPNGGTRPQPMCGDEFKHFVDMLSNVHCAHGASVTYFAESVTAKKPNFLATNRRNKQQTAQMGYDCSRSASGLFDLVTN